MCARAGVCVCVGERETDRERGLDDSVPITDRLQMRFEADLTFEAWQPHGVFPPRCVLISISICTSNNPHAGWLRGSHPILVKQTRPALHRGGGGTNRIGSTHTHSHTLL